MYRGVEDVQSSRQATGDLEQYRRLIELQKQMIKLSKQNEKAKRDCAVLREKVVREVAARLSRRSLSQRLRQKARKVLKRLPQLVTSQMNSVARKEPSLC
jgi:hypothetical protein